MEEWIPGSHGGTYGGNAVACAAAVATARVIKEEGLLENATRMGRRLTEQLEEMQEEFPVIGDLRGLGLMIATEFTSEDGTPATEAAKAVVKACLERGLMLLTCGPWNNTVRWIPPLIVSADQVDEAVGVFRDALSEVKGSA
jgi:4-aminobutyrate aminotransferase